MNKIKKVSTAFYILFQIAFVVLPVLLVLFWIHAPSPITIINQPFGITDIIPSSIQILHPLSINTKLLAFSISLIPLVLIEIILYFLIKLFRLYAQAEIFSLKNVTYIKYIAYTLLISQLINPVYQALMGLVLTWNNPKGHRLITISVDGTNFGILLLSLLIILISWIMAEGCKLREEQQYII